MQRFLISPRSMHIALFCLLCFQLALEYFSYQVDLAKGNDPFFVIYIMWSAALVVFYGYSFYHVWKNIPRLSIEEREEIRKLIFKPSLRCNFEFIFFGFLILIFALVDYEQKIFYLCIFVGYVLLLVSFWIAAIDEIKIRDKKS